MRSIVRWMVVPVLLVGGFATFFALWWRDRRFGAAFVNGVINPRLLRAGVVGRSMGELGTIEHVGRLTGTRHLTPVHPEPTRDGFRILVPLGEASEWAHNVVAAGRCRLQLHDVVHELTEPRLVAAEQVGDLPTIVRRIFRALGFEYLVVRTTASEPGTLEPVIATAAATLGAAA
jgi:hypothetical protein